MVLSIICCMQTPIIIILGCADVEQFISVLDGGGGGSLLISEVV